MNSSIVSRGRVKGMLLATSKLRWRRELASRNFRQVDAIPFESERQYAAVFHEFAVKNLGVCHGTTLY
jgi:hypothetical protein